LPDGFGQSDKRWIHGDSNYDGLINLADFNLLANKFGQPLLDDEGMRSGLRGGPDEGSGYTYDDLLHMLMEMHPEYS